MDISLTINDLIFEKKVKKVDLVRYLGISRNTFDNYLKGKTKFPTAILEKVAAYFSVPVTYFYESNSVDIEALQKENDYLKNLLLEKERTIKILMKENTLKNSKYK